MFISQIIPKLDRDLQFNTSMFDLKKIEGLENVVAVDLSTLVVTLNCYIAPTDDEQYVRLTFPRRTIQRYSHYFPSFSIRPFVQTIPQFIDKGAVLETLVGSFIIWKSRFGFLSRAPFDSQFPFLKDTKIGKQTCLNLISSQTNIRMSRKHAKIRWNVIYNNYENYLNKMNFMLDKSFGPEKFVILGKKLWWCLQDKNIAKFNFTELCTEIQNLSVFPSDVDIIFTVFYRCKVTMKKTIEKGNTIIRRISNRKSKINMLSIPANITLIIVDEKHLAGIIGNNNYLDLCALAKITPGAFNYFQN